MWPMRSLCTFAALLLVCGCAVSQPTPGACDLVSECCEAIGIDGHFECRLSEGSTDRQYCADSLRFIQFDGLCVPEGEEIVHSTDDHAAVSSLVRELDLVFVIDNSASMEVPQARLAVEIPGAIAALTTGDIDGDGRLEIQPVESLHVAVVTSDVGVGHVELPGCTAEGDDGLYAPAAEDCGFGGGPGFLSFDPSVTTDVFGEQAQCLVRRGTEGCSRPQVLRALQKALTSSEHRWQPGHATGANRGLLRENSNVAIILLTDRDDCSVDQPELFGPDYPGPPGLRCSNFSNDRHVVTSIDSILDEMDVLSRLERVFFGVIAGLPDTQGSGAPCTPDRRPHCAWGSCLEGPGGIHRCLEPSPSSYTGRYSVLDWPDMQYERNAEADGLRPVCTGSEGVSAEPARRVLEFARGFQQQASGTVAFTSICDEDYGGVFEALYHFVHKRNDICWHPYGEFREEVLETCFATVYWEENCASRPGRTAIEGESDLCRVAILPVPPGQSVPPSGDGVFFDRSSPRADMCEGRPAIRFTPGAELRIEPYPHSSLGITCPGVDPQVPTVFSSCAEDPSFCDGASVDGYPLVCGLQERVCYLPCEDSLDCPIGYRCSTGSISPNHCRPLRRP